MKVKINTKKKECTLYAVGKEKNLFAKKINKNVDLIKKMETLNK